MRNMMDGTVTGQGAGTAAAISIKVSSREIKEIDSIQARLLTITCYAEGLGLIQLKLIQFKLSSQKDGNVT